MLTFFANGREINAVDYDAYRRVRVTIYGLSSDEKPGNVDNATIFVEMDTKKIYFYDEVGAQWLEF